VPSSTTRKTRPRKTTGLRYWMLQVLEECEHVSTDFGADPVHDLRVALRRCRSLADGLMALDPDPDWKAMKKAGRRLFQRLGALRDVQVMMEWVEKLDQAEAKVAASVEVGDPAVPPRAGSPAWRQSQLTPDPFQIQQIRQPKPCSKSCAAASRNNSMKRNPLSKNSTANSGASGVSLFPHGPPAFGRAARSLSTSLWSAGPQPANSTTAPCAIAPKLRSTVSASASNASATSWKLSSCRAQSLEQRPQGDPGPTRRGPRSRCALGHCRFLPGFSRCRFARPLAGSNPLRA